MDDELDDVGRGFEEIADELYGLDPEAFVAARDRAAKELRAGGDAEAGRAVKALRRPTLAAWALNRLVRVDTERVDELLDTSRDLQDAQRAALVGEGGDLREIAACRQQIIDDLVTRTEAIITSAGRSPSAHADDIVRTLQASSDPDQAQILRSGRLVTGLAPVSAFGGLTAWFDESGAANSAATRDQRRKRDEARRAAEAALAEAERSVQDAQAEVERLSGELTSARRRVEREERRLAQRRAALDDIEDEPGGG